MNELINQHLAIIIVSCAQLIDVCAREITSNKNSNPSPPRLGTAFGALLPTAVWEHTTKSRGKH